MSCCSNAHKKLNEDGWAPCSVPMWSMGMPAGFCNNRAFGPQRKPAYPMENLAWAPYFACPSHGGPGCPGIRLGDGNYSGCGTSKVQDCPVCCDSQPEKPKK